MLAPVPPPLRAILHDPALAPGAKAALFAGTIALVERELAAGGGDPATRARYRALRATARRLYEEFAVAAREPAD
ncbi:MAG TPA: hypothetical protein VFL91_04955 [Thermomicrobiales bacterium]|nr:hypothetical protein [Thermomicrobiales bacterium]